MRQIVYIIYFLILLSVGILEFTSCEKYDPSTYREEGSNRDWIYPKNQVDIFINGVKQMSVTELRVVSYHTSDEWQMEHKPYLFETVFHIKGLLKKNKITTIEVQANLVNFIGTVELKGITYTVTGEYTGNCFADPLSELGVVIYLDEV